MESHVDIVISIIKECLDLCYKINVKNQKFAFKIEIGKVMKFVGIITDFW